LSLLKFILKEIRLIRSQRYAIILVAVYPILILITLAMVFSADVEGGGIFGERGEVDVAIYLPESNRNFDAGAFYAEIQQLQHINFHLVKSEDKLTEAIENRIADVAIKIHPPPAENKPIKAEIIFDNSSLISSAILAADAKFALEFLSGERSRQSITEIWEDLGTIRTEISGEVDKVGFFVAELKEAEARLADLDTAVSLLSMFFLLQLK